MSKESPGVGGRTPMSKAKKTCAVCADTFKGTEAWWDSCTGITFQPLVCSGACAAAHEASKRTRGRPSLARGEETESFAVRLSATDHDALVDAADELGVYYNKRPAKGTMARMVLRWWLSLPAHERRAALEKAQ